MDGVRDLYKRMKTDRIFLHLPAYREPELVPTIKNAIANAKYPERLRFGICRQYDPNDGFDDLSEFDGDERFIVHEMLSKDAKGLAYARSVINELLLDDEEYVLQLDAHHRFIKHWDVEIIKMHKDLELKGYRPILTGYLPEYKPFEEPHGRVWEPWMSIPSCFYPHGTLFIQPTMLTDWQSLTEPVPSRFICGHFAFARNEWAKEILHDKEIFFAGEEIDLTVRSFTHGYDLFHPHRVLIWHATMREERDGMLVWDDQSKVGNPMHWEQQDKGRAKIRQKFRLEDNGFDLTGHDLGTERTFQEYQEYSGLDFASKSMQKYTKEWRFPPNPPIGKKEWKESLMKSVYFLVDIHPDMLPRKDYDFILVAFDDENGLSIESEFIDDNRLKRFLEEERPIHFEKIFFADKFPSRVVYWGHSKDGEWRERIEINYN